MPTTLPRFWMTMQPDEAQAFELRAAAVGQRPAELLRALVLEYLAGPERSVSIHPTDLAAAAASLERTAAALLATLPAAEDMARHESRVEQSLAEIAQAVGTAIGAIVPIDPDDQPFGPDGLGC